MGRRVSAFCGRWLDQVFAGFSGHGNPIHNVIPLLKKETVHLTALLGFKKMGFTKDRDTVRWHPVRNNIGVRNQVSDQPDRSRVVFSLELSDADRKDQGAGPKKQPDQPR